MKILDSYWFNGGGIVRVETDYDGIKYYIRGDLHPASTEDADAHFIADYGNTFPPDVGDMLFGIRKDALAHLISGDEVILPKTREHALAMLRVAEFYLSTNDTAS